MKRLYLIVHGRVQGVFYRAHTAGEAQRLGLVGWVRNLASGDVEVTAEGEESALRNLLAWCEHGPPMAKVTGVDVRWGQPTGEFREFRVTD